MTDDQIIEACVTPEAIAAAWRAFGLTFRVKEPTPCFVEAIKAALAVMHPAGYWLAPMEATEDDLDAMVQASDASDRIQGFHYGNQFVIRDVLLADGEQVLWRGLDTDRPAFNQQLERERMRLLFAALRARQTQERT